MQIWWICCLCEVNGIDEMILRKNKKEDDVLSVYPNSFPFSERFWLWEASIAKISLLVVYRFCSNDFAVLRASISLALWVQSGIDLVGLKGLNSFNSSYFFFSPGSCSFCKRIFLLSNLIEGGLVEVLGIVVVLVIAISRLITYRRLRILIFIMLHVLVSQST